MAEQKTAKILMVKENTRTFGKDKTFYVHEILFDGSSETWSFNSLNPKCTEFEAGKEATFTIEIKENGQYKNYIIRPVASAGSGGGGAFNKGGKGGFAKSPEQNRLISIQSIFASVCTKAQGDPKIKIMDCWKATEFIYDKTMVLAHKPHPSEAIAPASTPPPVAAPVAASQVQQPPATAQVQPPVTTANPLDNFGANNMAAGEVDDLPF
jgi:hypothetical protein